MRSDLTAASLDEFFENFGKLLKVETKIYISGGASAVFHGWRDSSRDIDLKIIPDGEAFSCLAKIKEELQLNIELASPDDFIPAVPDWQKRCEFIKKVGKVEFYHFDFYTQALSKIERNFERDLLDVKAMLDSGLIEKAKLVSSFEDIQSELIKYPAIDPDTFKKSLSDFLQPTSQAS